MKIDGLNFDGITESKNFTENPLCPKNSSIFSIFSSDIGTLINFKIYKFLKKQRSKVKALNFALNILRIKKSYLITSK